MTGLYLHPLRLKALSEGRLSVLRVPFREQPKKEAALIDRELLDKKGIWQTWLRNPDGGIDQDFNAQYFKPPYAPGDYFVREAWDEKMFSGFTEAQGEYDAWGVIYKADYPQDRKVKWQSARSMPEEYARYILTLGPPVPGKLGEVDVSAMQQEGTFASLMQDPCDMAKQIKDKYRDEWNTIYPRHPWSPDLWTWAYPATRRKKTC